MCLEIESGEINVEHKLTVTIADLNVILSGLALISLLVW